jgi:hypothetical protein
MENFILSDPRQQESLLSQMKVFYRPMVLASLLLHTIVLFVPTGEDSKKLVAAKTGDEVPVKITQMPRLKKPKPVRKTIIRPKRPRPPRVVPRVAKPVIIPKPPGKKVVPPAVEPTATPSPQPSATAPPTVEPSPTPSPSATPSPSDTPQTNVDPVTQEFAAPLGTLAKEVDAVGGTGATQKEYLWKQEIPAGPLDFEDPTPFFEDVNAEKGKPGVISYIYLSPLREDAETFYTEQLAALYTSSGFSSQNVGTYAGGPVYEVKKGAETRFFSIVRGGSKSLGSNTFQQTGLIVVIWKQSPV